MDGAVCNPAVNTQVLPAVTFLTVQPRQTAHRNNRCLLLMDCYRLVWITLGSSEVLPLVLGLDA